MAQEVIEAQKFEQSPMITAFHEPQRLVYSALIVAITAFFAAAGLLWAHEGPGVFVEVLLAGISACF